MTAAIDHTKSEIVMIQPFAESDCFFLTCAHSFNHHEIVERYQKISWTPFRSLSTGLTFFFSFPFFSLSFPSLPFSFSLFVLRDSFALPEAAVWASPGRRARRNQTLRKQSTSPSDTHVSIAAWCFLDVSRVQSYCWACLLVLDSFVSSKKSSQGQPGIPTTTSRQRFLPLAG